VARRAATDYRDRVVALVLEASPNTLLGDPGLREFVRDVVSVLEDPVDPDFARSFVVDTSAPDLGPELLDALVQELLKVPAFAWRQMFEALLEYDDRDELASVAVPTLLIWGDTDPLVGQDAQVDLLTRIPSATLIKYAGTGHTPRWEDPARFAADVTAFVDHVRRHPGAPGVYAPG
jgi:pimeloyl-ACP methyl ester carboxylesterase